MGVRYRGSSSGGDDDERLIEIQAVKERAERRLYPIHKRKGSCSSSGTDVYI